MNNQQIRKAIKLQRANLPTNVIASKSRLIQDKLLQTDAWQSSNSIGAYFSHNGEVNCDLIIDAAWAAQKSCYLPVLVGQQQMQFREFNQDSQLVKNHYQIAEPVNTNIKSPEDLDLVCVPLVAFDQDCNRLGLGKGFYDRTFAFKQLQSRPLLIGLAYQLQLAENLLTATWDVPLDAVITEDNIYGELN